MDFPHTLTAAGDEFTLTPHSGSNAPDEYIVSRDNTDYAAIARSDSGGVTLSPFGDEDGNPDNDEHTYRDDLLVTLNTFFN